MIQTYWIRGSTQEFVPAAASVLQQGLVLHPLDSVQALASRMAVDLPQGALVLADLATASSAAMRALRGHGHGAGRDALALVVLADAVAEEDLQSGLRLGAVDMVPPAYARDYLAKVAAKHLDAGGRLRVDMHNPVVAIDGRSAMERMQSDATFFGSLLRAFFEELPQRQHSLREDWNRDPGQVRHHGHALKGLALSMGLESLAQLAGQAMDSAGKPPKAGDLAPALLLQLEGEMRSARFQILRWLSLHPQCQGMLP